MKKIKYIKLEIIFIVLFLIILSATYKINKKNTTDRIDLLLKTNIEKVKLYRDITVELNKLLANSTYKRISTNMEVINILSQVESSNEDKKKILREKLFNILKEEYETTKATGVLQLHFVEINNKSFLRMHKPDKYGDDLTNIRYSYKYVNESLEPIEGFEQGRSAHAYRYVFPLFSKSSVNEQQKKENYIGCVDISFDVESMQDRLDNLTSSHSHLIIKKDIYTSKIWGKKDQMLEYVQSIENEDYMLTSKKETTHHNKDQLKQAIIEQLKDKITTNMTKKERFVLYATVNNNVKTLVFLPIINIKDKDVIAWLVVYGDNDVIYETLHTSQNIFILSFIALFIIFYFMYKSFLGKELLKDEIIKVNESQQLLNVVFNTTTESIAVLDLESNFLFVNNAYEKMTGFLKEDLYKTSCRELTFSDGKGDERDIISIVVEKGSYLNFEKTCIVKDNKRIDVRMNTVLMPDKKRILITAHDITLEKQEKQAKELRNKQMILQSRYAQMGEMIGMIAHQWRQPLTAISARVNNLIFKLIIGKELDSELLKDELEHIGEYSQHLSKTIDDFRGFFKENKIKEKTTLKDIVISTLAIVQTSFESKNIKIVTDFNCGIEFETYQNELKQVVLNIIKNSEDVLLEKEIKEPTITIKTFCNKDGGNQIMIIKDNGGGIPKEIMDKIFEPYFSTKLTKDGTGLGLYMSKTIVEDHCGGKLIVSNDEDGAVFMIVLESTEFNEM